MCDGDIYAKIAQSGEYRKKKRDRRRVRIPIWENWYISGLP